MIMLHNSYNETEIHFKKWLAAKDSYDLWSHKLEVEW